LQPGGERGGRAPRWMRRRRRLSWDPAPVTMDQSGPMLWAARSMNRERVIEELLRRVRQGLSLRSAAALAGIHVATVCRWQARAPDLCGQIAQARREARERRRSARRPEQRPHVRWRRDCPLCRAKVVVRTARGRRFWRCGRWPLCAWASWRPRVPRNCRRCGAACFWSHSRKSIACSACGVRTKRPLTNRTEVSENWPSDVPSQAPSSH
jgi:hypothetical protein